MRALVGATVLNGIERSVKLWIENELFGEEIKMLVKSVGGRQEGERWKGK